VIKIEAPQGDVLRRMDRSPGGASYPFLMLNANKRSVRIDLKQPRGRELLLQLAEQADVLIENFAAGVVERLGIDDGAIRARNPRLIYASGSGFGSSGPYVGYPAMDFTIRASSASPATPRISRPSCATPSTAAASTSSWSRTTSRTGRT
jgi:formyl-CoA transferase